MANTALFTSPWWLIPVLVLLAGPIALLIKAYWGGSPRKVRPLPATAEANRLLGLALHGQGELDQAFEKFQHCPMDDALAETLYNLGLDYERKRQFDQATAVFRYIAGYNPNFRDLPSRLNRGQNSVEPAPEPLPPLGHYQPEKIIAKGAMGTVYQGREIGSKRRVAIKTLALTQNFDAAELADLKQRFFAEAETASRLQHPHIVSILEAGEIDGQAYIVMEFLQGHDLLGQTKPDTLLPLPQLLSVLARVAEALDYAHGQGVVHRDIKPANIMLDAATDQVKVTDFGIARLTDSTRTKAGVVLGTPSYMSPEQLLGQKIDHRTDIYSLGVTLYQLCCGQLPYSAESLPRLMAKIVNETPPDILELNPALPPDVVALINKAMHKNARQRYQRAAEMAADLRRCLRQCSLTEPVDARI